LTINSKQTHNQAEASFKKKEAKLVEGQQAMAEYNADLIAAREKTVRLKALRSARDSVDGSHVKSAASIPVD
jgi:hypothetical protein